MSDSLVENTPTRIRPEILIPNPTLPWNNNKFADLSLVSVRSGETQGFGLVPEFLEELKKYIQITITFVEAFRKIHIFYSRNVTVSFWCIFFFLDSAGLICQILFLLFLLLFLFLFTIQKYKHEM